MPLHDETLGEQTPETPTLPVSGAEETPAPQVSYEPVTDNAYYSSDSSYGTTQPGHTMPFGPQPTAVAIPSPPRPSHPPPPSGSGGGRKFFPPSGGDGGGDDEDGMARMSFLEHLEELRMRLFYSLLGFGVAFLASMTFCNQLWRIVSAPATAALKTLGVHPPNLTQLTPMEGFNVIWIKVPVLTSIFIASPWLLYQVWAFVSPGLYKRERKWAVPFVVCTAGLFISGGLFAYFVAFQYGLTFLLGVGRNVGVTPLVSINEYFDLFVNVTLGIGLVFEMPVLIFFLTLLRIVTPSFLLKNSRYAILIITIIAAVVTPTPDVFNLLLFATPMVLLFFVGVFASYILVLNREGRRLPWGPILLVLLGVAAIIGGILFFLTIKFHYSFVNHWPFFSR